MYKAILLNDTRRDLGHAGCYEVVNNIFYLCEINKIKIKKSFMSDNISTSKLYESSLAWANCLIVNGEGSLHDDNERTLNILNAIKQAKLKGLYVVLVNALWINNKVGLSFLKYIDYVVCRDHFSYNEVVGCHNNVSKTFDFSLYSKKSDSVSDWKKRGRIIFTDSSEKDNNLLLEDFSKKRGGTVYYMNYNKLSLISDRFYKKNRGRLIRIYDSLSLNYMVGKLLNKIVFIMPNILTLNHVKKSRFIISGRFHGIMLSVKYKKPFIYLPASNDKIDYFLIEAGLDKDSLNLKNIDFYDFESFDKKVLEVEGYFVQEGFDLLSKLINDNDDSIEKVFKKIKADLDKMFFI